MYPEARNRQGFDIAKYNSLREAIAEIEEKIAQPDQLGKQSTEVTE